MTTRAFAVTVVLLCVPVLTTAETQRDATLVNHAQPMRAFKRIDFSRPSLPLRSFPRVTSPLDERSAPSSQDVPTTPPLPPCGMRILPVDPSVGSAMPRLRPDATTDFSTRVAVVPPCQPSVDNQPTSRRPR